MSRRPWPVTIIGWIFAACGAIALAGGAVWLVQAVMGNRTAELREQLFRELIPIGITWALALVGGIFLLRGRGWARWLLVAWAAFHVILSILHPPVELLIHALLLVTVVYFLFRPGSSTFFRKSRIGPGTVAEGA